MKIKGTSSYILVEIDGKTVKIQGEMIINGFVAYADTIKHWESPNENESIDEQTKQRIVEEVSAQINDDNYKIIFE